MLIKSNLATVLDFGSPNGTTLMGGKSDGVKIPGMQLIPGLNEIDPEVWAMWTTGRAKCAGLDWHLAEKHIEVVKVEVEPADEEGQSIVRVVSADDFADLNAGDAIDLVKETFDVAILKMWFEAEKEGKSRTTVGDALLKQRELLEASVAETDNDPSG